MANAKPGKIIEKDTKEHLSKEEKVTIRISKNEKNKDETIPVCINGCNYFFKRGETVSVPKTIARILELAGYI